jgi:hypothetical protein
MSKGMGLPICVDEEEFVSQSEIARWRQVYRCMVYLIQDTDQRKKEREGNKFLERLLIFVSSLVANLTIAAVVIWQILKIN